MGPRPRRLVVGEEALVRRCRGWGRASALVVAEHAASLLGLCLVALDECLAAPGAAPPALSWLLDERCYVQTLPPGLGARERCAPGAPCSCPGWAGSVRPGRHGPSGARVLVGSTTVRATPWLVPGSPTAFRVHQLASGTALER